MAEPDQQPLTDDIRSRIVAFLPRLGRFCRMLAGSEDKGDDLLQSSVERALSRIGQWQQGTSLESWMFRIARNLHIDGVRAAATRGFHADIADEPDIAGDDGLSIVEGRSDLSAVNAAFGRLPQDQQALMALVVVDGCSYKEAAEILDIPIGTVMSRLSRARAALAQALGGEH